MAKVIEPLREDKKLVEYLTEDVRKVGIVFWHGLGDCVQFIALYNKIKELYPKIEFKILIQNGLGQEVIFTDAILMNDLNNLESLDYDYIFLIHFPVEQDPTRTKSELCAKDEIGLDIKIPDYGLIPNFPRGVYPIRNKLVGIHFQNTALPSVFNPSRDVAEKIWNEILEAGHIPIELDFQHAYHNPVNEKFDFIDCSVRRVKATVTTLLELVTSCKAVIAVVSGPLHCALATIPERTFYLEKGVPIERFVTWQKFPSVNVDSYQEGLIKNWLENNCEYRKKKIFVLEDMPDRQEAFKLKFSDYDLTMINNVKEALEILSIENFDLICLDHDLSYDPATGNGVFLSLNDPRAGGRVAEFLSQNNFKGEVIIQSLNGGGAEYMNKLLPHAKRIPFYWKSEVN